MADSSESAVAPAPPRRHNLSAPWQRRRPVAIVSKAGRHLLLSVIRRDKDNDDEDNEDDKDNNDDDDKNEGGVGGR
jgi:hypothetical protein